MSPILGAIGGLAARAYGWGVGGGVATDYESISTVTVGAGGSATVTFSSIPSTYSHLQLRAMNLSGAATGDVRAQFNSDTASNYSLHYVAGNGASTSAGGGANTTYAYGGQGGSSANPAVFVLDVLDYANVNKYKTTRTLSGYDPNGAGGWIFLGSGNWRSTSAITSISLFINGFNFNQYSSFALYGIK